MRKYLEEIGIAANDICIPNTEAVFDGKDAEKRNEKAKKEREEYGYDSRETWSLDYTAAVWLYEHLRLYLDKASEIVDINYHRFKANEIEVDENIWACTESEDMDTYMHYSESEKTQEEWIRVCIEYLTEFIQNDKRREKAEEKHKDNKFAWLIAETIGLRKMQHAFRIFAEISPAMWW